MTLHGSDPTQDPIMLTYMLRRKHRRRGIEISIYVRARDVLDAHGELSLFGSLRVCRTFTSSGSGPRPFRLQRGGWTETNGRAAVDTVGRAFTYIRFQRDPRARSLVSESKSTFECARKHSKINDLCDTRRERVRADRQPVSQPVSQAACLALPCHAMPCLALPCLVLPCLGLPCLPTDGGGCSREETAALCHFSLSPSEHCIRVSPSRSGEPSYETIDPIPWIPHHFKRRPPRPIGGDRGRGKYMSARLVSMSYKKRLVFFCTARTIYA